MPGLSSVIYAPNALQIRKSGISPISRHITASSLSTLLGSMRDRTSTPSNTPYIHDTTGTIDHRHSHSVRHRYASCQWIFQHLRHWRAVRWKPCIVRTGLVPILHKGTSIIQYVSLLHSTMPTVEKAPSYVHSQ